MRRKLTAFVTVFFLIAAVCIPLLSVSAETYNYVETGLEALYIGNNNTGDGQDKNATVWKDLSGKNRNIDLTQLSAAQKEKVYFTDYGLYNDSTKVFFPDEIKDVMNGDEFTVEIVLGDVEPKGSSWNTFINSSNDSFSLFRLVSSDQLVVKSQTDANRANTRPIVNNGLELFRNSTVTVTFKLNGKLTVYVDGVKVKDENAQHKLSCNDFFFGHDDTYRNHATEYRAIRFYSKELTASEVAANYEVDKVVFAESNGGTSSDTSSAASSATSSAPASSSSSSAAASTSSAAQSASTSSSAAGASSSAASSTNPQTGENDIVYAFAILGILALTSIMVVVRNKRRA